MVGLAGCSFEFSAGGPGEIAQADLESDIAGNITGEEADQVDVTCDGPLPAEVDASVDCLATYTVDDSRTGIRPVVTAVEGEDVEYDPTLFLDGETVAETVETQLRNQAVRFEGVECEELIGERGASSTCTATDRRGETPITTTVTGVDGLTVDFEFGPA